ncbi:hypothetical protein [Pseudobacter ginsenosidimutans]|uniref:PH (Pleckstrin Homology) domain-containing protein n=1 Tax=Pseudobacter ginsenosidimutans TaxID=661488 RepID=A0A4Q7MFM6_9BACT|nr:hypothetical protein [Pseudobacter ginsenosidimutans]QEC45445.1 hypothetical protein FSB84_28520 [Pseudobacter ginsenosidimutans]RZS66976.1 hypothetical protein EV199_5360 [Pseudobacter ginsenosidimutans]
MRVEKPLGKKLFSEDQQFRQWWLWLIIIGVFVMVVAGNYSILMARERNYPKFEREIVIFATIIPLLNLLFFYIYSFQTVITDEGIYYRWRPFRKKYKEIKWNNLLRVAVKDRFMKGLGAKYQLGYGWTHQVSGKKGVEIEAGGSRVWLGTQRMDALLHALEKAGIDYVPDGQMKQKTNL